MLAGGTLPDPRPRTPQSRSGEPPLGAGGVRPGLGRQRRPSSGGAIEEAPVAGPALPTAPCGCPSSPEGLRGAGPRAGRQAEGGGRGRPPPRERPAPPVPQLPHHAFPGAQREGALGGECGSRRPPAGPEVPALRHGQPHRDVLGRGGIRVSRSSQLEAAELGFDPHGGLTAPLLPVIALIPDLSAPGTRRCPLC